MCARHEPDELPTAGSRTASFVAADIRDPDAAAMAVDTATRRLGRLDVVVNDAGGGPGLDAANASPRVSSRIIELNLLAPLYISQRASWVMQAQPEGGSVIMVSSISGAALSVHGGGEVPPFLAVVQNGLAAASNNAPANGAS